MISSFVYVLRILTNIFEFTEYYLLIPCGCILLMSLAVLYAKMMRNKKWIPVGAATHLNRNDCWIFKSHFLAHLFFWLTITLHQVNAFYCIFCNFYDNYATFLRQETRTNKDTHMEASSVYQDKMPQPQHAASYLCLYCLLSLQL